MRKIKSKDSLSTWMKSCLEDYENYIRVARTKATCIAYVADVKRFLAWMIANNKTTLTKMSTAEVIKYLREHQDKGKAATTVRRYHQSIGSFVRFLKAQGKISTDLTENVPLPAIVRPPPYVPTREEIQRLLGAIKGSGFISRRDRAICLLIYSSGLRATEMCQLTPADLKDGKVTIRMSKRGKTRTVPVSAEAWEAVEAYRNEYRGNAAGQFFETLQGKKMTRQVMRKVVAHRAKLAGLEHMTTHTLRHACATHFLEEGADLRFIQELLGHESIATTERYTHLTSSHLEDTFNKFNPRRDK